MTPRKLGIMKEFHRYGYGNARQVQRRWFPNDKDCADTRRILRELVRDGWLARYQPKMVDTFHGNSTAPVYAITTKGASMLVTETGDASYFLTVAPGFGQWMSISHYLRVRHVHEIIDAAFARQSYVKQLELVLEHHVIDQDASDPDKRFRLYTTITRDPKPIFFCPDSAFETLADKERRAWFVEVETGSDTVRRVFAKKHKGVAGFARGNFLKTIFPESNSFRVLCICPNAAWRDALREEFKDKPGEKYWVFCSLGDLTAEKFLSEPIMWKSKTGPSHLLQRSGTSTGACPVEGNREGSDPVYVQRAEVP